MTARRIRLLCFLDLTKYSLLNKYVITSIESKVGPVINIVSVLLALISSLPHLDLKIVSRHFFPLKFGNLQVKRPGYEVGI